MKKSLFYLFAILFMAGTVTACSSSDNDKDENSLKVSVAALSFESVAGEQTFDITSNVEWAVNSDQEWCVVTPTSGKNEVTVKVTENRGAAERTAKISIVGKGVAAKEVKVTQKTGEVVPVEGPIVGEWKLMPSDMVNSNYSIILSAERKEGVSDDDYSIVLPGFFDEPYELESAVSMGAMFGSMKLAPMVQSITFKENGQIVANYFDIDAEGSPVGDVKTSPEGLMSYILSGDNKSLKVTPNAEAIIAKMKEDGTGNDMVYGILREYLKGDFDLESNFTNTNQSVAISTNVLPLLLANIDTILNAVKDLPLEGALGDMVKSVVEQIPALLNNTKEFRLGLNLVK